MAVHNEKYKEILGLLGDMYVKYIDIDNSVTSTAPFIQKILKDISEEEIVDLMCTHKNQGLIMGVHITKICTYQT